VKARRPLKPSPVMRHMGTPDVASITKDFVRPVAPAS
jgi:hypothetical protein